MSVITSLVGLAVLGLANQGYAMDLVQGVSVMIGSALEPLSLLVFGGGLYMVGNAFRRRDTGDFS